MATLLKQELFKDYHNKSIWGWSIFLIAWIILGVTTAQRDAESLVIKNLLTSDGFSQSPFNIINLIMVILSASAFTREFSNGTIKLLLSRSFSRLQVFLSKIINLFIIYIWFTIISWIINTLTILVSFHRLTFNSMIWHQIINLTLGNLLYLVILIPIILLISMISKGPNIAITFGIITTYASKIIALILNGKFMEWHIMNIAKWNPFNILMVNIQFVVKGYQDLSQMSNLQLSIACIIYGIVFSSIAYLIFSRRNI